MRRHLRLSAVCAAAGVCGLMTVLAGAAGAGTTRSELYTWPGAVPLHVYANPEGAGWIRSDPYRIDCPNACTRAFDPGTMVTLTAHPTSGFTFAHWTGPCADQGNPCTVAITADMGEVSAIYAGAYEP